MSKPVAPTRADAMSAGKQVIESGQLERRLTDLVALRTESQDPGADCCIGTVLARNDASDIA